MTALVTAACLGAASTGRTDEVPPPLTIRSDNTVIVELGDYYGVAYLQQYLLKAIAKSPDADAYSLEVKPAPDRAASPGFPVLKLKPDEYPADKNVLVIGPMANLPSGLLADADRERLKKARPNAILIKRTGNVVVITKRDPEWWNLAHVRVFLDKCAGVRLYAPYGADGLDWLSRPATNGCTIGALDIFQEPCFAKATFSSGGQDRNLHWLRFNCILTEGKDLRANHAIIHYFPPEMYYAKYPQFYPMGADGKRPKPSGEYWNPCLGDPELAANVAMEQVRARMTKRPAPGFLSFGVMDARYSCLCPACKTSMQATGGQASTLWYDFLNRVARQCRTEFPGLYLTSYVYSNVRTPPVGMRIESNIAVDNVIKSYLFTDKGYSPKLEAGIMEYASLGASWVTHDWNFSGVTPRIYSRQLASMLQWGHQHGMLGMYTEWSAGEYWYLDGANYWVLFQLLSDPYQETDALWRQYCRDMFGAGWEPMYRFYDMFAQKHVTADAFYTRRDWPREEACGFSNEDVAQQRKWLEEATAVTRGDPMIQKRLAAIGRYFRAHELLVDAVSVPGRHARRLELAGPAAGVDRDALAFYVNDDASKLVAFDTYYDTQRTVPPDSKAEDNGSSLRFSYRNNYSRALGMVFQSIRQQALAAVSASGKPVTARALTDEFRRILREHLPAKRDARRTAAIEAMATKIVGVPRAAELPAFDGDLSDKAWKPAAELKDFTLADLMVPTQDGNETEGRVMRVGDQLVIGLVCAQPGGIWAETKPETFTGSAIYRESCNEFFFGPAGATGRGEFAQYVVNSLGAFRGYAKAVDNRKDVQCAVKVAEDGKSYTVEAAFPLKVDGQYDYTGERMLSFNIPRSPFKAKTFNPKERIGWAPIFFTAGNPESRGLLILE